MLVDDNMYRRISWCSESNERARDLHHVEAVDGDGGGGSDGDSVIGTVGMDDDADDDDDDTAAAVLELSSTRC